MRNKEKDSASASIPETVIPVASYSKSKGVPSTSTDIVSAYTNAVEIIVNKINPIDIFKRESTLGNDVCFSEYNSFTAKLFICMF